MISPDAPYAPAVLTLLLVALVGLLVWRAIRKDRREYRRFKQFRSSRRRRRMYRKWLLDSLLTFGGASVVLLLLVWQYVPLLLAEIHGYGWVRGLGSSFLVTSGLAAGIVVAVVLLIVVGSVFAVVAAKRAGDEVSAAGDIPAVGDIQALLPRNRVELGWGAALSINAGIVEELVFRLAVPALLFGILGNAALAVVLALVLFGALHLYQGAAGVIGSTVIGGLLMLIYLGTGSILAAIVVHALIDLRSLVAIPVLVQGVHRRPGSWSQPPKRRTVVAAEPESPPL